ncbi:hypothetical protein [Nonomuraea sp. NPDC049684]|uniref:hypothetical protein n=1 Tax=Nonomuraea sp. NPDC049684 TaxID=3364356 RepID=UPI0037B54F8E
MSSQVRPSLRGPRRLLSVLLLATAVLVVADAPPAAVLPAGARGLWSDGGRVARGARSVVVGHRADPGLLADLARRADLAGRRVSAVLGRPVRALVVVPDSDAEAARLASTGPLDGLAAVADGARVIVVPGSFARLTPTGRDVVLTHELTHVAAGTDRLPVWLYEGFADYVAYRDAGLPAGTAAAELAADVRAGRLPSELPGPAAFAPTAADPGRLARAYQEAWMACRFLADRFGDGTLVRLYRDARVAGVDQALASVGLTAETLAARWREYVRQQLA